MSSIFSKSFSAAEFEKPRPKKVEKTGFVLIKFERTKIDLVREISETGTRHEYSVPMIRQSTEIAEKIFCFNPLS